MNQQLRPARPADDFLGAGDPGAIEAIVEAAAEPAPGRVRSSPGGYGEAALIEAFRQRGFLAAGLDPLRIASPAVVPELDPLPYGVPAVPDWWRVSDWPIAARSAGISATSATARIAAGLPPRPRAGATQQLTAAEQMHCLALLARTFAFEAGLARRLPGGKLFGIGGAETFNRARGDGTGRERAAWRRTGGDRRHASRPVQSAGQCLRQAVDAAGRRDRRQAGGARGAAGVVRRVVSSGLFRRPRDRRPSCESRSRRIPRTCN